MKKRQEEEERDSGPLSEEVEAVVCLLLLPLLQMT